MRHIFTAKITSPGVVGREEVGKRENFHDEPCSTVGGGGFLASRESNNRANTIAHPNVSPPQNLGEHALAIIFHQGTQSLADGVHFATGIPRHGDEQKRFSNFDLPSDQRHEVDAAGLDVGADQSRSNDGSSERARMFMDFFPFDEADLPLCGLSIPVFAGVITRISNNPFLDVNLHRRNIAQRETGRFWMEMQRRYLSRDHVAHPASLGLPRRFVALNMDSPLNFHLL